MAVTHQHGQKTRRLMEADVRRYIHEPPTTALARTPTENATATRNVLPGLHRFRRHGHAQRFLPDTDPPRLAASSLHLDSVRPLPVQLRGDGKPHGGDYSEGHEVNPMTGSAYASNIVPRGDYSRVLAEFWADGPESETPPGHWFVLLNGVLEHPDFNAQWLGEGEELDAMRYTVRAYLTLGGAMHDAAIAAWSHKGFYDYIRPVSAIRYMASLGQRSDSTQASYHPGGMPLVPGRIEVVEAGDPLASGGNEGKIKVLAWQGPDAIISPFWDEAEVGWILAEEWWPYQRPSFVTPPFAGYVSGHSTFSRAAAEVLTAITGSPYFPGGMGEFEVIQNQFLVFEDGPSQTFNLQWATYRDASDQCSLSRIWGGIHPPADDFPGRQLGVEIAELSLNRVSQYFGPLGAVDLCPLDLDGDGVVGATDLLDALADFGESGPDLPGDVMVTTWWGLMTSWQAHFLDI